MQLPHANLFSQLIKAKYSNSRVILGGPGTVTPQFVDFDVVDSIMLGEGEISINDFIFDEKKEKEYTGKAYNNINSYAFPARYLVDNQGGNIFGRNKNYFKGGSAQIITSRGCNHKCAFCAAPKINDCLRFRDIDNVIDEIKDIIKTYGIKQFRIADDNFTANRNRVFEFCEKVAPLGIVFRISARVKPLDIEMLKVMKGAGLKEISLGVETFDDNVLRILKKKSTVADNYIALDNCKIVGIKTRALLMIGTPGQTYHTIVQNMNAIKELKPDVIACTRFIPIPGSDIYENPKSYRINIINYNLEDYNFYSFGKDGRRILPRIIEFLDRDTGEVERESELFLDYLQLTGRLNQG